MHKINAISLIIKNIVIILYVLNTAYAQCLENNTVLNCSGGNGILVDNANINTGDHYWWNTGATTINNINLNGGILTICGGNLTINNINFNGGWIYIYGGTLTINNNLNISGNIINYGNLYVNGNFTLQGNPSLVFNQIGGTIQVTSNTTIQNNSQLINSSTFITNNLTLQTNTSPSICQNANAIINVNNDFTNNTNNSIVSYGGNSCIHLANSITLNQNLSNTSNLLVCDAPGGTQSGSGNFGSATHFSNCSSCSFALPIVLNFFKGKLINDKVLLEWQTLVEINNYYFEVEKSEDAINFVKIATLNGAGFSNQIISYNYLDNNPHKGINYYRLKQVDFDGKYSYSNIIAINFINKNDNIHLYPNPIYNNFIYIKSDLTDIDNIYLINFKGDYFPLNGKLINNELIEINMEYFANGIYFLIVNLKNQESYKFKVVKLN